MIRHMLAGVAAALSLLSASGLAHAQATPSKHGLELAGQIIEATGAKKTFEPQLRQMLAQLGAGPETRQFQDAMVKGLPHIMDAMAQAYARTYSESELQGILDFYKAPAGQAMVAKQGQLTQETMAGMMAVMPQIIAGAPN